MNPVYLAFIIVIYYFSLIFFFYQYRKLISANVNKAMALSARRMNTRLDCKPRDDVFDRCERLPGTDYTVKRLLRCATLVGWRHCSTVPTTAREPDSGYCSPTGQGRCNRTCVFYLLVVYVRYFYIPHHEKSHAYWNVSLNLSVIGFFFLFSGMSPVQNNDV